MFAWTEKKNLRSQIRRVSAGEKEATSANRRAIGLLPSPTTHAMREVFRCADIKYHQLLLQIEARQSTCCVRVMCPSGKSRAAILIFRGRVLGCVYGNKRFSHQQFGEDALKYTLSDMIAQDTIVEVYLLTEEIALAAASMFHSKIMAASSNDDPYDLLERGIHGLMRTRSPGCVIINNCEGHAVCMVYVFGGKIVAVYSFLEGWMDPTFESAELCLASVPDPQVSASCLTARSIDEVLSKTFSLTGLNDRRPAPSTGFVSIDFNPYESKQRIPAFSVKRTVQNMPAMQRAAV
jgi:hypothetical protein